MKLFLDPNTVATAEGCRFCAYDPAPHMCCHVRFFHDGTVRTVQAFKSTYAVQELQQMGMQCHGPLAIGGGYALMALDINVSTTRDFDRVLDAVAAHVLSYVIWPETIYFLTEACGFHGYTTGHCMECQRDDVNSQFLRKEAPCGRRRHSHMRRRAG